MKRRERGEEWSAKPKQQKNQRQPEERKRPSPQNQPRRPRVNQRTKAKASENRTKPGRKIMRLLISRGKRSCCIFKRDRVAPKNHAPFVTAWKNHDSGAVVLGISGDSVDSHRSEKVQSQFPPAQRNENRVAGLRRVENRCTDRNFMGVERTTHYRLDGHLEEVLAEGMP